MAAHATGCTRRCGNSPCSSWQRPVNKTLSSYAVPSTTGQLASGPYWNAATGLAEWLQWADLQIDNLRAVLQRCLNRGDTLCGIELAAGLGWFWITRATTEGMRWLGEFLAAEGGDARTRARAYFIHGFLAVLKADPVAARPPLYAAVATARQAGQPDVLSDALSMASIAEGMAGDHATARRLLNEAHATTTGHAYPPGKVGVAQARVLNGYFEADLGAVRSGAAEGVRLARETGDLYGLEMMLLNLG